MNIWLIILVIFGIWLVYRYTTISSLKKKAYPVSTKIILLIIISIGIISWIIFEEITGAIILHSSFFSLNSHWETPTLGDSGEWVWRNWIIVILFYGIIMGILSLLKREETRAKEMQALKNIATVIILFAFFGIPVMSLVVEVVHPEKVVQESTFCRDISNHEVRTCKISSRWSNWIKPEPGTPNGLQECFIGTVYSQNGTIEGDSVFRFKSRNGITVVYYKAKSSCEGDSL